MQRFLSVDPLTRKFAMLTPYQYGSNNPVWNIDLDGLEGVTFQDVLNSKASVVDWINNPNAWKAGLDNISSLNPFWHGYVHSYEIVTGKDYNTGEAKSRLSSAIEGTGKVMFTLTVGKFLKIPNASAPLEMQMAQNAKAVGQPLATPAQQAVKTVEEKGLSQLGTPVQQTAKTVDGIISKTLRVQKQVDEHIIGGSRLGTNSYLNSVDDATNVLNATHSGSARVLSTNIGQNRVYVQYNNVTGYYNNNGDIIPTNKFLIKGGKSSTVVPIHPNTTTFK